MARTQHPGKTQMSPAKSSRSDTDDERDTVPGIRVTSLTPSFHRAGFKFTREGLELRLDDLTEQQAEAIAAEPMLNVRGIHLPALADSAKEDATTASDSTATNGDA